MKLTHAIFAAAMLSGASAASAVPFVVDALANSSSGGSGVNSLALTSGQAFTVSVAATDLWSAGPLPRWSNADGLLGNLFATGSDESGYASGTQIGAPFGLWTQNGLTAAYGTLVGEMGGVYKALGTSFAGTAWATDTLHLYYWDSNNVDNTQFITANVSAIPEPASWALIFAGFLLVGGMMRRRGPARVAA